jgi:hypothetical protein
MRKLLQRKKLEFLLKESKKFKRKREEELQSKKELMM